MVLERAPTYKDLLPSLCTPCPHHSFVEIVEHPPLLWEADECYCQVMYL